MLNKLTLIGNVGIHPETHVFENGNKIVKISLATSESWKDKQSGERKEKTTWHNLQFSGALVDVVEKHVKKGDKLYIEGKVDNYSYDDKDGVKRYSSRVTCNIIKMLTSKNEQQQQTQSVPGKPVTSVVPQVDDNAPTGDDDLPF